VGVRSRGYSLKEAYLGAFETGFKVHGIVFARNGSRSRHCGLKTYVASFIHEIGYDVMTSQEHNRGRKTGDTKVKGQETLPTQSTRRCTKVTPTHQCTNFILLALRMTLKSLYQ